MTLDEVTELTRKAINQPPDSDMLDALAYLTHTFRVPIRFVGVDWGEAPDVIDVECKVIEPQKLLNP
jgi:hypothetical protein